MSGGAWIEDDPALRGGDPEKSGDFTFECFFRTTEEGLARSVRMEALGGQKSPSYYGAWDLMIYDRKLWARWMVPTNAVGDTAVYLDYSSPQVGTLVTPDVWHHAAVTYTLSERKVRLYLDYKLQTSFNLAKTGTGRVVPGAGEKIYIGKGRYNNDRSLDGDIAEVRFSDEALLPEQFLRFRKTKFGDRTSDDPDVVAWYSLDSLDAFGGLLIDSPNLAFESVTNYALTVEGIEGAVPAVASTEVGYSAIRASLTATHHDVNQGSLALSTNNCDNSYLKFWDVNNTLSGASFTQEFMMRVAHAPTNTTGSASLHNYGLACSQGLKILLRDSRKQLCRFKTVGGDFDITTTQRYDDGQWHHVAVVYDKDLVQSSFYVDYSLVGSCGGTLRSGAASPEYTFGSANEYSPHQPFDGWLDEIRITKRALKVEEFLSTSEYRENLLFRMRFEGDYSYYPNLFQKDAMTEGYVNGSSVPTFVPGRAERIDLTADGGEHVGNAKGLRMEGGGVALSSCAAINRSNITIEFFWRPYGKSAPWPTVLGLANSADGVTVSTSTDLYLRPPWTFDYEGTWDRSRLMLRVATTNDTTKTVAATEIAASPRYTNDKSHKDENPGYGLANFDGKWHHVAVTLEERTGEDEKVQTRATTYWDYTQLESTGWLDGPLKMFPNGRIVMGKSGVRSRLATWDIDEVRITAGLLTPEQFLHVGATGILLIFR